MAEDPVQVVVAGYAGFFEQDRGASQGIWCRALFTISKDDPKISRATWEMGIPNGFRRKVHQRNGPDMIFVYRPFIFLLCFFTIYSEFSCRRFWCLAKRLTLNLWHQVLRKTLLVHLKPICNCDSLASARTITPIRLKCSFETQKSETGHPYEWNFCT